VAASAVKGLFHDPTGRNNPGKPFDVFVSCSSKDKQWADTAVAYLEQRQVRCWVAPRDILAGREWGDAIIDGIDSSRLMVLMFSAHANDSGQVRREVERAISKGLPLIPFRIEEVAPKGAMEYALGNTHWLDGFTPPVERHLEALTGTVRALLSKAQPRAADGGTTAEVHVPQPARKRWPLLAGIAVAVMLLGLLAAWAGGLLTKKQEGTTERRDEVTTRDDDGSKNATAVFNVKGLQLSNQYKIVLGDWSSNENELIQSDFMNMFSIISFGDENWTDYDFSVSAMRVKGVNQFGLGVRNRVRGGPEMLLFTAWSPGYQLELQKPKSFYVLKTSPVPFEINNQNWYTAKVSVRGSRCQCFLGDGKTEVKVVDMNDASYGYAKGAVVLRTLRSQYRFKDIKVVAADGRTLWEGPPRIDPTLELERKR
jgi:hypothetical protein